MIGRTLVAVAAVTLAGGCASSGTPAAEHADEAKGEGAPDGWWVETEDAFNPTDVGVGARFHGESMEVVKPNGGVEHPVFQSRSTRRNEWTVSAGGSGGAASGNLYREGDTLRLEFPEGKVVFRKASSEEGQRFDALVAREAAGATPPPQ